jgi:hypothetical protein
MTAHRPGGGDGIGEACPCDHGSQALMVSSGLVLILPSPAATSAALPFRSLSASPDPHTVLGFPFPIEHPPNDRA